MSGGMIPGGTGNRCNPGQVWSDDRPALCPDCDKPRELDKDGDLICRNMLCEVNEGTERHRRWVSGLVSALRELEFDWCEECKGTPNVHARPGCEHCDGSGEQVYGVNARQIRELLEDAGE